MYGIDNFTIPLNFQGCICFVGSIIETSVDEELQCVSLSDLRLQRFDRFQGSRKVIRTISRTEGGDGMSGMSVLLVAEDQCVPMTTIRILSDPIGIRLGPTNVLGILARTEVTLESTINNE